MNPYPKTNNLISVAKELYPSTQRIILICENGFESIGEPNGNPENLTNRAAIEKIEAKIRAGAKKLTKKEDAQYEAWDNTHTENEFILTIGLDRDMTSHEKKKIINGCYAIVKGMGYGEVDMA